MFQNFSHWNPSPEIFTIPGIDWPVRWYGLMWALSFIGSHFIMNRIYRTEGRTEKDLDILTLYIIIGTVAGARLGHCLFYDPAHYLSHPLDILKVYEGGLASHGGAIGILAGMWLYCRKTKESLLWVFDKIVVVAPQAIAKASPPKGNPSLGLNVFSPACQKKIHNVAFSGESLASSEESAQLLQAVTAGSEIWSHQVVPDSTPITVLIQISIFSQVSEMLL